MSERNWERVLREGLGDAWDRTQDAATSLVAETVSHWPDILDDDLRWTAAASLVLDLLGQDDEVHTLLMEVLETLYGGGTHRSAASTPEVTDSGRQLQDGDRR